MGNEPPRRGKARRPGTRRQQRVSDPEPLRVEQVGGVRLVVRNGEVEPPRPRRPAQRFTERQRDLTERRAELPRGRAGAQVAGPVIGRPDPQKVAKLGADPWNSAAPGVGPRRLDPVLFAEDSNIAARRQAQCRTGRRTDERGLVAWPLKPRGGRRADRCCSRAVAWGIPGRAIWTRPGSLTVGRLGFDPNGGPTRPPTSRHRGSANHQLDGGGLMLMFTLLPTFHGPSRAALPVRPPEASVPSFARTHATTR